ncbi:histidine phosphatase family protein [Leptolyngbya cf. ectocarpi LEGE 11479]|uniref:Histidine phosphatase family protein n=1 Tax=Leptolyngbya cf. ectocarpi LEGE 11479 TaxID=1828722 RepID=A0A928X070_LEPEC|nr:histidine phosphatase family protein [Leptolyngbya ectocarpi]MBE9065089.1 histidine phosphatase family protein [Leptolyngbya cf. ectocarpi LEGE 11479]
MKTRVIVVRHGESTFNVKRIVQGHHDESLLTDKGEHQAAQVGQLLKGIAIDVAYCSPLKRAARTAALITQTMGWDDTPQPTDLLKEISLPLWEAMAFSDIEAQYPEEYQAWRHQPQEFKMSVPQADGTTQDFYPVRAVWQQAIAFWQDLLSKHQGQTVLVVAHSAINRALVGTAIGLGPEALNRLYQANCGVSVLNFPGAWGEDAQLESMNSTSHTGAPIPVLRSGFKGPRLLLVRHGETDWNRESRFQGQIDIPLNENGRVQAAQAGEFLKAIPIDSAVSSSMMRPKETAEIILQHHREVSLTVTKGLWEIGHGQWEGKFEHEIEAGFPGMLVDWQTKPETVQMPEGENLQDVWDRAAAAWQEIVAKYSQDTPKTILVVAHDAINKCILCQVTGLGPEAFWQFKQGNGAVSVIDYPDGVGSEPMLSAANITVHLSGSLFDTTAAGAL